MKTDTATETAALVHLALGRIFHILSRPLRQGDIQEYGRCRKIVMDASEDQETACSVTPLPGWNFGSGNSGSIE